MFTSRSEFRLSLRADNADERLTPKGIAIGAIRDERRAWFEAWQRDHSTVRSRLNELSLTPNEARRHGFALNQDGQRRTAFQLLAHPGLTLSSLAAIWPELGAASPRLAERIETDARYEVYLERQAQDAAAFRRDEAYALPAGIDFGSLSGLSAELRSKLDLIRPATIGHAARIEGMTPAALTLLAAHAKQRNRGSALRDG
jgi:tRNA uridine 5-carboxymethylaminomethyl modification enzyme